ncbi:hypothetical protein [Lutibacter sp. Hel_I_33_5]|nr:hypothetical protein [Lutibacter sp. Hel_I_33_5]
MKKIALLAICITGILCFSSCRSTSKPCGLAENTTIQSTIQPINGIQKV